MTETSTLRVIPTGNPFTPGRVVPPERFVGRQIEIRELQGRLSGMLSVALVGEARIGKSSLLAYLEARLPALAVPQGRYVPVRLSMDAQRSKADFCRAILVRLLAHLPPGSLPESELRALEQLPSPNEVDLQQVVELAYTAKLRPVLLLDEFKHMAENPDEFDEVFLGGLRSLYTNGKVAIVLATRQPLDQIPRLDLYFANGITTLTLQRIKPEEAEALIRQPSDHPFDDAEVRMCVSIGDCHPLRLQIAGFALYQAKSRVDSHYYDTNGHLTPQAWDCLRRFVIKEFAQAKILSYSRRHKPGWLVQLSERIGMTAFATGDAADRVQARWMGGFMMIFVVVILLLFVACGLGWVKPDELAKMLLMLTGGS